MVVTGRARHLLQRVHLLDQVSCDTCWSALTERDLLYCSRDVGEWHGTAWLAESVQN
jgi:hypothetical protein